MAFVANRKKTSQIKVGNVPVGDFAPISVQSMTTTPTADVDASVSRGGYAKGEHCRVLGIRARSDCGGPGPACRKVGG